MHGLFRWSSKWWPGVIPLVIFWAIAAWTSTAPLEADLAARSQCRAQGYRPRQDEIAVAGRDVTFAADAFSEDGRRSAVASVEAVPGVRLVNDETRLVPEAKPFVWSAERDVVRVTLGGSAPLPASKGKLLEAARAGARRRRGRRSDEFGARRAAAFRQCRAAAARSDRQIEGRQDHAFGYQGQPFRHGARSRRPRSHRGGAEKSARGFSVAANEIKAPPYIFQAYKDPVAVTLTLTGYVPDNNVHAALVAAAGANSSARRWSTISRPASARPRICQRGGAGAGRAVAAVDGHAGGVRPRGEAFGRRAL
jgi:OOP family OmpA-OmpF porin